jgi:hypothetical protein
MSNIRLSITKQVELRWGIQGIPGYAFGDDKILYNTKRNTPVKQTLKNGCIGYWIGKRFKSINQLKPLLIRPKHYKCPF